LNLDIFSEDLVYTAVLKPILNSFWSF